MEEPIISIYDMLMKRTRKQRKEDQSQPQQHQQQQQQQQQPPQHTQSQRQTKGEKTAHKVTRSAQATDGKRPKLRLGHTREDTESRAVNPMATNVVTAMHLTKKQTSIVLKAGTKKEALSQLVSKMTSFNRRRPPGAAAKTATTTETATATAAAAAAAVTAAAAPQSKRNILNGDKKRQKAGKAGSAPGSASSSLRPRLALSPRNTNRSRRSRISLTTSTSASSKREKTSIECKMLQRRAKKPASAGHKIRPRPRLSKLSMKEPEPEVVRYRI